MKSNILLMLILTSCSTYNTHWQCPKAKGIGCSSIEYADLVAKEQIILNKDFSIRERIIINFGKENIFEEVGVLR